jgi:hypothetical protein
VDRSFVANLGLAALAFDGLRSRLIQQSRPVVAGGRDRRLGCKKSPHDSGQIDPPSWNGCLGTRGGILCGGGGSGLVRIGLLLRSHQRRSLQQTRQRIVRNQNENQESTRKAG